MRVCIASMIDQAIHGVAEIPEDVWDHNERVLDGRAEFGDPPTIERIAAARRIADALVGKLITATDEELTQDIYLALVLSPFRTKGRNQNTEQKLHFAAETIVAKLRQSNWRLFRNPPSYAGHARMLPPRRCENCD